MGYECKTECQIEVSPGVFKFIVTGQTMLDVEKKIPISYVKPISRKYFKLTGADLVKDVKDKKRIVAALNKRKVRVPRGARTSDVAKLLAIDNKQRGIVNLESLEIVAAPTHFADQRVIDAKARIDELFEFSAHDVRPYKDDESLESLLSMIDKKETELAGDPSDDEAQAEITEIKAYLDKHKVNYQPNTGIAKLRGYKEAKEKELADSESTE